MKIESKGVKEIKREIFLRGIWIIHDKILNFLNDGKSAIIYELL